MIPDAGDGCEAGPFSWLAVGDQLGFTNDKQAQVIFTPVGRQTMRTRVFIAVLLMTPLIARANPVMIDGQSLIAFAIVAFWAVVIESGIATLALVSSGVLVVPSFVALAAASVAVFLLAFLPLTNHVSLWVLEPGVVVADALAIKALVSMRFLQGRDYVGVSWRRALAASLLGNAASFFTGVLGSHAPWIVDR